MSPCMLACVCETGSKHTWRCWAGDSGSVCMLSFWVWLGVCHVQQGSQPPSSLLLQTRPPPAEVHAPLPFPGPPP